MTILIKCIRTNNTCNDNLCIKNGHLKMLKSTFTCDVCANTFTKNDHLIIHKLSFTCDICANTFT